MKLAQDSNADKLMLLVLSSKTHEDYASLGVLVFLSLRLLLSLLFGNVRPNSSVFLSLLDINNLKENLIYPTT